VFSILQLIKRSNHGLAHDPSPVIAALPSRDIACLFSSLFDTCARFHDTARSLIPVLGLSEHTIPSLRLQDRRSPSFICVVSSCTLFPSHTSKLGRLPGGLPRSPTWLSERAALLPVQLHTLILLTIPLTNFSFHRLLHHAAHTRPFPDETFQDDRIAATDQPPQSGFI
jgi:hypothetical protein